MLGIILADNVGCIKVGSPHHTHGRPQTPTAFHYTVSAVSGDVALRVQGTFMTPQGTFMTPQYSKCYAVNQTLFLAYLTTKQS